MAIDTPVISRRGLINATLGLAAGGGALSSRPLEAKASTSAPAAGWPFATMRDYVAALDEAGLVVRIPRIDQDEYEAAALFYRMRDEHGMRGGPTLIFDEVRIDGSE